MSKSFWIHAGLTVLGTLVGIVNPAILQFAAHHSAWSALIIGAWSLIGAWLNPKQA